MAKNLLKISVIEFNGTKKIKDTLIYTLDNLVSESFAVAFFYCLYVLYWQDLSLLYCSIDTALMSERLIVFILELPAEVINTTRNFSFGEVAILLMAFFFRMEALKK